MTYKWIGAILIVAGCGGFGFSLAATCRQEKKLLMQMLRNFQMLSVQKFSILRLLWSGAMLQTKALPELRGI